MSEPKRLESLPASEVADRDSRAEALLLEGLDRYFAGRYDDAIHVWTRVLFLDRSHARARAYIDRARTAIAERQRRAEELLHATGDLLAQGQTERARALLAQAEAASGDDSQTALLRVQLERMERARVVVGKGGTAPAEAARAAAVPKRRSTFSTLVTSALVAGSAAAIVLAIVLVLQIAFGWGGSAPRLADTARPEPVPILSSSEVALVRARTFYARGRLAEALVALERVDRQHPRRAEADKLRIEIQNVLLGASRGTGSSAGGERGSE
jgi:tetratricopeptide (TPR) repeat protein